MYSQNEEEKYILEFFKDKPVGRYLDIGAADGKTLSNTYALYEKGWSGVLVEPSPGQFSGLLRNITRPEMRLVNVALDTVGGIAKFHVTDDFVSTLDEGHYNLWKSAANYRDMYVSKISVKDFLTHFGGRYDFLNLDVEGINYALLKEIPIDSLGFSCVCIEYENNLKPILDMFNGWKRLYTSGENIVLCRNA